MQITKIIGCTLVAVTLSAVIACASFRSTKAHVSSANIAATHPSTTNLAHQSHNQDRVSYLSPKLNAEKDDEREAAQRELIMLAHRSAADRDEIIRGLLKDVEAHDELDGRHAVLAKTFYYWFSVTKIFSELKATEAIDSMIRCIHCGNGYSGSFGDWPAFDALQNLGRLAVPKLSHALTIQPDEYVRSQVALCLGTIGGDEAERALRQARRTETSKDVLNSIKRGLATIENERRARASL
jgi:HEAT repeat protein